MAPPIRTLQRSYRAVPDAVPDARSALTAFAADVGAPPELLDDVRLAVSEALTNAVVHAYRGTSEPGSIGVIAARAVDELWILVSDSGCGLRPRQDSPGLGLGMALMMQLSAGVDVIDRSDGGTEVTLRFALAPERSPARRQSRGAQNQPASSASIGPLADAPAAARPGSRPARARRRGVRVDNDSSSIEAPLKISATAPSVSM
jgi:anti-sigma regulatory factor (Ser/Thr protein kinase)